MARTKKNIQIVVVPPNGQGMEEFQKMVNEVYCEMVRQKLLALNIEVYNKRIVLERLIKG